MVWRTTEGVKASRVAIVRFVQAVSVADFTGTPLTSLIVERMRVRQASLFLAMLALVVTLNRPGAAQTAPDKSAIDGLYRQGIQALQQGNLDTARTRFETIVRLAPNAPEGHNSLGWVLMSTGKIEEAIPQFRSALTLNPDFLEAHVNLANALLAKKDKDDNDGAITEAVNQARIAVKLAPGSESTRS